MIDPAANTSPWDVVRPELPKTLSPDTQIDPGASPIEMPEWKVSEAPAYTPPTFTDSPYGIVRAPDPSQTQPGFPERAVIDPSTVVNALNSLRLAPDALAGAAKLIPGVSAIGDALGGVGRAAERVPGLGGVGGFLSDTIKNTAESIMRRAGETIGEVGKTFDSSNPDAFKFLDAPLRIAGAAVLGKTGAAAFDFGKPIDMAQVMKDAPQDVMDTIGVASLLPAFKAAGLIGKAAEGGLAPAQALRGFVRPFESGITSSTAENFGRFAGKLTAATYGAGTAVEAVVPKVGGNEWWAKQIMENRIAPEDSKWRFPMDLFLSLPLDLGALTKYIAGSRQAAWVGGKIMGGAATPLEMALPDARNSIGTTISKENFARINSKLIEDTAGNRLIEALNRNLPDESKVAPFDWQQAAAIRQETGVQFKQAIANEVDRMFSTLGTQKVHELAADTFHQWTSTPGLPPGTALQLANDYADFSRLVEPQLPDRILAVDDMGRAQQVGPAINYLESIPGDLSKEQIASFKNKYPALGRDMEASSKQDFLAGLKNEAAGLPTARGATPAAPAPEKGVYYHGSGTEGISASTLDLDRGDIQSLFGPGLYVTDREQTAVDYALKRGARTNTGALYRVDLGDARKLDMDAPLPPNAINAIREALPTDFLGTDFRAVVDEAAAKPGATGASVWGTLKRAISEQSHDESIPTYEYAVIFQDIREKLVSAGYDAMAYKGGVRTGSPAHDAMVILNRDVVKDITPKVASEFARAPLDIEHLPPPARLGLLQAQLDDINARIYRGEKLGALHSRVTSEMKVLREQSAAGFAKQKEIALADKAYLGGQAFSRQLSEVEQQAAQQQMAKLDASIKQANEDYYKALLAGSRWHLETPPSGPVMKITDEIYHGLQTDAQRTLAGKTFDTLFGAVRNSDLGKESMQRVMNAGADVGVQPEIMRSFMDEMRKFVDKFAFNIGSVQFRLFASAWHLPSFSINKIAKEVGLPAPKGFSSWSEVVYRSYPGPFNIFARQLGKELPNVPYSPTFHTVTRSLYGTFRFSLDPRFILLNFKEPEIIQTALAHGINPQDEIVQRYIRLIKEAEHEVSDTGGAVNFGGRERSIAMYAWSRRPDEWTQAVVSVLRKDPAMQDVIAQYGIKTSRQMVDFMEKTLQERYGLFEGNRAATRAEESLAGELKKLDLQLGGSHGVGEESLLRAERDRVQSELVAATREREFRAEALKQGWKPELQPFLDAAVEKDRQLIDASLRAFRGNPDRSAIERVMNSYLLYWPLSYQIKATKLLAEFMFSRGLGYRTGSAGAQTWLEFRARHEQMLQDDPEYASFFKKNSNLLFMLQQIIPITPEDLGVSLSPIPRVPFRIARGEAPAKIFEKTTNQGLIYTSRLGEQIVRQETAPGGMFHDLFDWIGSANDQGPQPNQH